MSTLTASQLQQQYIAYFGRPGDPAGINFWLSSGITEREFADNIYAQDEYKTSTVGTKSTEEQVNQLYKNLFGRSADAEGLLYWTGQIENGTLSLSNIALDLIYSANNPSSGNTDQGALDAAALSNKLAAATAFTADLEASTDAILAYQPASTSPWDSGSAFESAQSFLTGITSVAATDAGIDTAVSALIAAKPAIAAENKILTDSLDIISTGDGDDTISGSKGTIDSDTIDGGAGTDTLSVTLTNADDNNSVFTSSNVENLKFRVATGNVTLDLGDVTGVESITADRLAGNLTLNDVQEISSLTIDRNTGNDDVTVDWNATVDSGTTDAITINVINSSDAGTINVDNIETVNLVSSDSPSDDTNEIRIDAAGSGDATEVLNISGAGDTTVVATDALTINNSASGDVTLTPTAATTINHTGTGTLTTTTGVADVTVTASGTGALDFTDSVAGETTVTGGSGDDEFNFGANLEEDDVIVGGTGTDTLVVTGDATPFGGPGEGDIAVSGVETLEINSEDDDNALDFDVFANPAEITTVIVNSTDEGDEVTLNDTQASTFTINNGSDNTAEDIASVVIDLKDATGTTDAITINLNNTQTGDAGEQDDFAITTGITANDIETINLNTSFVSDESTAEVVTLAALTTDDATTLNISGTADLTITAALDTDIETITSTSTGDTTLTLSGGDVAYTGGSGVDTLNFGTSLTAADTVDGGDGTDVVNATFNSGTVTPANFSNVETFNATFSGGALNASGLTSISTINIVDTTTGAVLSGLANTTTTITQQGSDIAAAKALNLLYASGADATVTYNNADATENVLNSATSTTNIKNLTVAAGDGEDDDRTVSLGSLNGGTSLDSLTLTTGDDIGDTLTTGNITAANLETLTITADEADITVGTFASAGELKTLTIGNLDSASDGNITIGAIGAGSAADEMTSFTVATSGSSTEGTTVLDMDNIDAEGATFTTFSVDLNGTYGASDIGIITADVIGDISLVTGEDGTSLAVDQFLVGVGEDTSSVGNVTINSGAAFDGLAGFITTGTDGTVGNISITSEGVTTIADGANEEAITDAVTVGDITLNVTDDAGSITLGDFADATTIGNVSFTGTGSIAWDGAPVATTIGNISGSVADGETVDLTAANGGGAAQTLGTTDGVMGTTTVTGDGTFNMDVGAVATLGNIDLSGMSDDATTEIALDNATAVGVIYTGSEGGDTFTGTGGGDTINPGLGIDTVTGGDGADNITITEATASVDTIVLTDNDSADTITGFTATDVLAFSLAAYDSESGGNDLIDLDNDDLTAGVAIDVHSISDNDTDAAGAIDADDNIIFFTNTDQNAYADFTYSFALDANAADDSDGVIAVFYDADGGFANIGVLTDASSDADATFNSGEAVFTSYAQASMTSTVYATLDASNLSIVA